MKAYLIIDKIKIELPRDQDLVFHQNKDDVWISYKGSWYELLRDLKTFGLELKNKQVKKS